MVTLIIFLLMLVGIMLILWHKKTGILLLLLSLSLFILSGTAIFPSLLWQRINFSDAQAKSVAWGKQNAIILLGSGTVQWPLSHEVTPSMMAYGRIVEAAHQYFSCKKASGDCTLIISGGDAVHTGLSEAESYQMTLQSLGVDPNEMILEKNSMNTFQNAQFTRQILKRKTYDRIVLVTSSIHLKRALLYFAHFDIHPLPIAADYLAPQSSWVPTAYNLILTDIGLHEFMGVARLYVYDYLGLNHS